MSIDFRIRDFFYPRKIWRLHQQLEKSQWYSPEQLREFQEHLLQQIIEHSFECVPYYRELASSRGLSPGDVSSKDDLRKLPLLTKEILRGREADLRADNADSYRPKEYTTSGTTGQPLSFYLDRNANALEFVYYWRYWGWSGFRPGMRFAELTSHYFLVRPELSSETSRQQRVFNRLLLNSNQLSIRGCLEMAEEIRRFRPRFLKGVSSTLYFLALSLKEAGVNDISFQAIFSTGEVLTKLHRTLIEEVLNGPVYDSYGHMERTVAICQCPEGTYHVNSDYGLLEFVDHESTEEGELLARAVGTGLYNRAMPLIRYDIGDQIELFEQTYHCPCGRGLPTVKGIHGRTQDVIRTPDGRFVTALFIIPEFIHGAHFVQFIQVREDTLVVHVVPSAEWDESNAKILEDYCRRMIGDEMQLRLESIDQKDLVLDDSNKIRTVIGLDK